ncbi:unnamed protein product [Closterium sp. Naga37s-1]|nr:unnamed protein product [Closterium sp. Naga37s-1]
MPTVEALARFTMAQHNAAKNDSLQPVGILDVYRPSAGNASTCGEEYRVSLAALNLLRGRTTVFNALLSHPPLVAARSALPAAALPLTATAAATAATAENGGGEGGGEGWEYTLKSLVQQAGSGHASTREEQEAALRHVVPVTPPPCGNMLIYVDLSDADVQRVAREAVASAYKRQMSDGMG